MPFLQVCLENLSFNLLIPNIYQSIPIIPVFVPLTRMPLTPNGKVDKNGLPFPDTARFRSLTSTQNSHSRSPSPLAKGGQSLYDHLSSPLERTIHSIFQTLLGITDAIRLGDNFFDIGGHSILATRLVFELRKSLAVDVPLNLIYRVPTIGGLAAAAERLLGEDLNMVEGGKGAGNTTKMGSNLCDEDVNVDGDERTEFDYAAELDLLDDVSIRGDKPGLREFSWPEKDPVVFITGVTGFLGAFLVRDVLRKWKDSRVIALVRGKTDEAAFQRTKKNLEDHLVWEESWEPRLECLAGDLSSSHFGFSETVWSKLCDRVDMIIHNGAMVHWVYPYSKLKGTNVLGTIEALRLATTTKNKTIHFVSSTSVLDTEDYIHRLDLGDDGKILESDNLEGSRRGLRTGYGQSKWISEKLILLARSRNVKATIIRPGYIVGDSVSGVTNVDDFLWRLVKGCIQLGKVPVMTNCVNMCSVDYVSAATVQVLATPNALEKGVYHIFNSHRYVITNQFFSAVGGGSGFWERKKKSFSRSGFNCSCTHAFHFWFYLL